ncbi:MAG: hypothetical protein ABSD76_06460 [Terriglobales bacterium]|jgi:hypothetical protein
MQKPKPTTTILRGDARLIARITPKQFKDYSPKLTLEVLQVPPKPRKKPI